MSSPKVISILWPHILQEISPKKHRNTGETAPSPTMSLKLLHTLLKLQDEKRGRSFYEEEPKLKALCKLSLEIGENQNGDFLGLITNFLKLRRIETSTRLSLFRFLYENLRSQDERDKILNEAVRFKSGHIRAWATSEIKTNRKS